MSRYGLKKAPKGRKKKPSGFFAWLFLLGVVALFGWIIWNATQHPRENEQASRSTAGNMVRSNTPGVLTNARVLNHPPDDPPKVVHEENRPGTPRNFFEAQVALARLGISPGCIDGSGGSQTRAALRAFQAREGLPQTGDLDSNTKAHLVLTDPAYSYYIATTNDLQNLAPVPESWVAKSEMNALGYENLAELVAEKTQASITLIQLLNPHLEWSKVQPGTLIRIPWVTRPAYVQKAAFVRIRLNEKVLEAFGSSSNLLAHFPCSIAKKVEKRPVGRLTVAKIALNPNYVFDPAIFPESAEAREIDHKLVIPPGPNNPVGVAWIGLDKPGYGIHGTPKPEQVGRTESHGCFRLANWNAEYLAQMVWVGLPVYVEP